MIGIVFFSAEPKVNNSNSSFIMDIGLFGITFPTNGWPIASKPGLKGMNRSVMTGERL